MLVCLEGPDRAGKTTLLDPLTAALMARQVCRFPTPPELMAAMPHAEVMYLQLFNELYDPSKVYVCDRSPTLSAQVYSRVFERPSLIDVNEHWIRRQIIVFVETPLDVLVDRHRKTAAEPFPLDLYEKTLAEYERLLPSYTVIRVKGTTPTRPNVDLIVSQLREMTR